MDTFIFRSSDPDALVVEDALAVDVTLTLDGYVQIPDIAGESLDAIWGTNGTAYDDPALDALTMPRVLGFEDPLFG